MPLNVPSYDKNDFSFGPAVVYIGTAGATPTVDVGAITEDGVSLEITRENRMITQGNPKIPIFSFAQAEGVKVTFTGIEWDITKLANALGAGVTSSSGGEDVFAFGGDPLVSELAIKMVHQMAVTGHTASIYIWKAVAEGGMTIALGQDEHQFPNSFMALRSATDWAGTTLNGKQQLMKVIRQTT